MKKEIILKVGILLMLVINQIDSRVNKIAQIAEGCQTMSITKMNNIFCNLRNKSPKFIRPQIDYIQNIPPGEVVKSIVSGDQTLIASIIDSKVMVYKKNGSYYNFKQNIVQQNYTVYDGYINQKYLLILSKAVKIYQFNQTTNTYIFSQIIQLTATKIKLSQDNKILALMNRNYIYIYQSNLNSFSQNQIISNQYDFATFDMSLNKPMMLIVSTFDKKIIIFDFKDSFNFIKREKILNYNCLINSIAINKQVTDLAFSCYQGKAYKYSIKNAELIQSENLTENYVKSVGISNKGNRISLLTSEGYIQQYQICNSQNCLRCQTANNCSQCQANYNVINGICISCNVSNCIACNQNNICSKCASGYNKVNSNTCIICNSTSCHQISTSDQTKKVPFVVLIILVIIVIVVMILTWIYCKYQNVSQNGGYNLTRTRLSGEMLCNFCWQNQNYYTKLKLCNYTLSWIHEHCLDQLNNKCPFCQNAQQDHFRDNYEATNY